MKYLLITLLISVPLLVSSQDEDAMVIYQSVYLTPDGQNLEKLRANMKAHNQKFHNEDPYTAYLFSVTNGPNAGQWIWAMGPISSWAELDNRPGAGDHDNDWDTNIVPYIKSAGPVEYWKLDAELSNDEGDDGDQVTMYYNRFWKVNSKYGFLVNGLLKQVSATVKAMDGENPWYVWDNQFRQGDMGRHLITSSPMKNWAELDEDNDFQATFKKVHGENSWIPFIRSMSLAFEDSFDEIWVVVEELGGSSD